MKVLLLRDVEPFDEFCAGEFVRDSEGFWRFRPSGKVLNGHDLRTILEKLRAMNTPILRGLAA